MPPDAASRHSPATFPPARRLAIRRRLLAWYDAHRRDLPWRRRPGDGYAQLLAEFMLQQTQVSVVEAYYERFLQRFPTLGDLASAEQNDVLALWSGLGYYSRARNLHAAAQAIVERHAGTVPRDLESLLALPGIGRYTAGAIASITYDVRAPVLDGNVARLLCRLLAITEDPKTPAVRERLWEAAEEILPRQRCGDFNQALMELGATICLPQSPQCLICPLRESCEASAKGLTSEIPSASRRTRILEAEVVTVALRAGDRLLFVRRPQEGLWAGLWELPSEPIENGDGQHQAALQRLQGRLPGGSDVAPSPTGSVTRQLTHRRIRFHLHQGAIAAECPPTPDLQWLRPDDLGRIGLSRACQAVLGLLEKASVPPDP